MDGGVKSDARWCRELPGAEERKISQAAGRPHSDVEPGEWGLAQHLQDGGEDEWGDGYIAWGLPLVASSVSDPSVPGRAAV